MQPSDGEFYHYALYALILVGTFIVLVSPKKKK